MAARRPGTYWLRFSVASGLLVLATWVFITTQRSGFQETGRALFYLLTGGLTLFALTAGVRSTADCLSEEKREGTLGLLFLTDLRGYDVVAGKLVANSLNIFYGVLAVLPILGVPLLMGGVTGAEFARLALVLVNTLFFSLGAGMLASALCQQSRVAAAVTTMTVLLFALGIPALGLLEWKLRGWQGEYRFPFLFCCPGFSYVAGVDHFFNTFVRGEFYWSVGIVHLLGWVFLALASWQVRHRWQDQPVLNRASTTGAGEGLTGNDATTARVFRTRLLDQNAFFWLAARPQVRVLVGWWPLVFAVVAWIWGYAKQGSDWFEPEVYVGTAFLLSITIKAMIGAEAGRRVLEDRRLGAMELLLSTALTVRDIVRGQWLAMARLFLWPVVVMYAAVLVMWIVGFRELFGTAVHYWFWIGLGGMVMFAADAIALFYMGMWLGLSSPNPRRAFGSAVAPILALPWVCVALVMTLRAFLPYELRQWIPAEKLVWWSWFGFSLLADFGYATYARCKLLSTFRDVAGQRFEVRPTFWQQITGRS